MGIQRKIEIINSIQVGFDNLREDLDLQIYANRVLRGLWNRKIKTSLCNAGRNWDYYVCANRVILRVQTTASGFMTLHGLNMNRIKKMVLLIPHPN